MSAVQEEKKALRTKVIEDTNPRRSCLNHFCKTLEYFTSLVALTIGTLEVLAFFYLKMTVLENILTIYMILFCMLIIMTELNIFNVAKESKILNLWPLRGLFYIFVGILGLNVINMTVMVGAEVERSLFKNFSVVFSFIMIGLGVLYAALGLLCIQMINDKMEHNYQDRKKRAVDIKNAANKYGALTNDSASTDGGAAGTNYVM
jgi:hypothetical protein